MPVVFTFHRSFLKRGVYCSSSKKKATTFGNLIARHGSKKESKRAKGIIKLRKYGYWIICTYATLNVFVNVRKFLFPRFYRRFWRVNTTGCLPSPWSGRFMVDLVLPVLLDLAIACLDEKWPSAQKRKRWN
ncbi:unnamed protein product, partial [Mesorhabditis belari]|uniref:Uncharacterized protein n=1 Tax=Mesorhabditis belari TaxID=2138241 RepID=A0AAF3EIG1_9BILA